MFKLTGSNVSLIFGFENLYRDAAALPAPACVLKGSELELVWFGLVCFNPLKCFFGSEGHVALERNPGYDTLLLRMIPGDLLSAFPHRQFHTLPGLLDSWDALPNSNRNACMSMQGGILYHFYDGPWYDPAERRTHDLPCERRTRYRLSQPDTSSYVLDTLTCRCLSNHCHMF